MEICSRTYLGSWKFVLEQISMNPNMFEPLKLDCIRKNETMMTSIVYVFISKTVYFWCRIYLTTGRLNKMKVGHRKQMPWQHVIIFIGFAYVAARNTSIFIVY